MSYQYFELQFESDEIFKGEYDQSTNSFGQNGILHKADYLILGQIETIDEEFEFTGYGIVVD